MRKNKEILEEFETSKDRTNIFYKLVLEVLLDIRSNTEKVELTKENIANKIKEMKDMTEGISSLAAFAKVMENSGGGWPKT